MLTELDTITRLIHNGSGKAFDTTRSSIAASKGESREGVLMRLDTIRMIDGVGGQFVAGIRTG